MRARLVAAILGGALAIAGCGQPGVSAPSFPPASPVEGVVVHVESTGLTQVTSFDLRTGNGAVYSFLLAELTNGTEFPPGHLTEHQANAVPVRVYFAITGKMLFATRLEDAEVPTPPPS
jgi:hypothetical protein